MASGYLHKMTTVVVHFTPQCATAELAGPLQAAPLARTKRDIRFISSEHQISGAHRPAAAGDGPSAGSG